MPPRPYSSNFDRDIGSLQATVANLAESMKEQAARHERTFQQQQEQMQGMIHDFKNMLDDANEQIREGRKEIASLRTVLDEARGSWRVLTLMVGAAAAAGALFAKLLPLFWSTPRI